jgi:alpha-galactosidase
MAHGRRLSGLFAALLATSKWSEPAWYVALMIAFLGIWSEASFAQLAATPPMGWNSWNHFGAEVTDADIRAAADAIVSTGMRESGYEYINIDDGWQGTRSASGELTGNERFPDMRALADYVHSRGLY